MVEVETRRQEKEQQKKELKEWKEEVSKKH